mmetsp:Transcript_3112/g.7405  ORF Transcript_3112/g.7405 Transcript_3112/m.7405 type:complete len:113 (+) Transcript_3112:3-341(+)
MVGGASPHSSLGAVAKIAPHSTLEQLMAGVRHPLLMLPAANDPGMEKAGGEIQRLHENNGRSIKIVEMKTQSHGWTTRAPLSDPGVQEAWDTQMAHLLQFFKTNFGEGTSKL